MPEVLLLGATDWQDYELLDSGDGLKLERFGDYTFIRPEHQAIWSPKLSQRVWNAACAEFVPTSGEETGGKWKIRKPVPDHWVMRYKDLVFQARFTQSRHLGVFPEQAPHWEWIAENIRSAEQPVRILNLFGYTGLASLCAAQAGASVTHVDASKKAIGWARENQSLSNLSARPIRWILDDAMKFVQREYRRQSLYDGILMDPPKFGRGPKGEIWSSMEMLKKLLEECRKILKPRPRLVIITAYAIRASALSLYYALAEMMNGLEGTLSCGELVTVESSAQRILSSAIFARWCSA